ncbi:SAM pointed domain-containing Ets transcription factor-like [Diadema antillarum]|uniref:SAM pointed domain-containing Ets transcription factor-like n=1 Tax=Diadema antillarum TaxID=105358 RepID=UPI003A8A23B1
MFSTGDICVLQPVNMANDPDALRMAEIQVGSTLLDMDMQQQHYARSSESCSPFSVGSYNPASPDSFNCSMYPDPVMGCDGAFQTAPMGGGVPYDQPWEGSELAEDEMTRLLMREMIPSIVEDCQKLNLHPNMYTWTPYDVQRWVACVVRRYELGEIDLSNFFMDGMKLASMTDEQFKTLSPKAGDILCSILTLLKSAIQMEQPQVVPQVPSGPLMQPHQHVPSQTTMVPTSYVDTPSPSIFRNMPVIPPTTPSDCGSSGSSSDEDESSSSPAPSGPNTSMTPNHTGGIQLWQFLKELLLQPNSYTYCIRWLDRNQGIFKIEDSVEVARLWGMRKNRPAMNYDKLSRSIRQYYKKGIMKKTEVSQRLVYQFVHPF